MIAIGAFLVETKKENSCSLALIQNRNVTIFMENKR